MIDGHVSSRLDALRACAAFFVFAYHLSYLGYTGSALPVEIGRLGVLVFFVMSGYVIAYVTEHKHRDLVHYLCARFARLYSVFLPALLLTVVCDAIGRQVDTSLYDKYPDVYEVGAWLRLPFFLGFLFENSMISLRWFSNGPMWSIAYEFWYYVLYGVLAYTSGWRRFVLLAGSLLLAGWKIMLLAPVWFAGVLLYRHQRKVVAVIRRHRLPLFWFALIVLIGFLLPPVRVLTAALSDWSGRQVGMGMYVFFLSDYLQTLPLLLLVATLIVPNTGSRSSPVWGGLIGSAANCSFSVYLYHVPLILLVRTSGIYDAQSLAQSTVAGMVVFACCYLLATMTEHRKNAWLGWVQCAVATLFTTKERIGQDG